MDHKLGVQGRHLLKPCFNCPDEFPVLKDSKNAETHMLSANRSIRKVMSVAEHAYRAGISAAVKKPIDVLRNCTDPCQSGNLHILMSSSCVCIPGAL